MNIFHKMADMVRSLSMRQPQDWARVSAGTDAGEHVNAHSVLSLSAVWACVNLLSGTISSLPLMVYRKDSKGNRVVDADHPLYRLLHDSPNFDQTAVDFWDFINSSIELWGNGYARKLRSGVRIVGLVPINPAIVQPPRRLQNGKIEYRWSQDGQSFVETDETILHIRGFGGDPLGGMSTLHFGRQAFALARATDKAAGATFRNGLRPSGVLKFAKFLTPEQRNLTETKLVERFESAMNAARPMILEGGTEWQPLTINPEDAQMLESRSFSVEEICRFFGVPPFMVGHNDKASGYPTSLSEQVLTFQKFALRRRLKRIEQALEKQLLTAAERAAGVTIEFNLEGLLRGDSMARAQFYASALMNGWTTINEVRALENLPPVAGGDVPRMQSQNIPITQPQQQVPVALPAPQSTQE